MNELPLQLPAGEGEHIWLDIEKNGANTAFVAHQAASSEAAGSLRLVIFRVRGSGRACAQTHDPTWRPSCVGSARFRAFMSDTSSSRTSPSPRHAQPSSLPTCLVRIRSGGRHLAGFVLGRPASRHLRARFPGRKLSILVRADAGACCSTSGHPGRPSWRRLHWDCVRAVSGFLTGGLRTGCELDPGLHARHADGPSARWRQPRHHGLCPGAVGCVAQPGAAWRALPHWGGRGVEPNLSRPRPLSRVTA